MINNAYSESVEESGTFLRIALQQISRHKLPYNPITYSVWYEFATGNNPELTDKIHNLEKEHQTIPLDIIHKLFKQYIADNHFLLAEKKITEFQTILSELTTSMASSGSDLNSHGGSLVTYAKKLGRATSLDEIPPLSKNIISATKNMVASGQSIAKQMNDTASEIELLRKELEGTKQKAKTDPLTGLLNRAGFDDMMSQAMDQTKSDGTPLCLVMADIDHFKKINDTHGHLIGDNVLKMLARLIKDNIDPTDTAARFGGEEFILVLPGKTLEDAFNTAEKIRKSLKTMRWVAKESKKPIGIVTISMGAAQYTAQDSVQGLIHRADQALYAAKESGRDKTLTENDIEAEEA